MEQDKHALWFAVLVIVSLATYGLYGETRRSLSETNEELHRAQEEIARIVGESEETISTQRDLIVQKDEELEQSKESEELLQEAVASLQNTSSKTQTSLNSLLSDFAPAVVRLVCLSDSLTRGLQQGSGVLYKGTSMSGIGPYYVQTNLHVIETEDGSSSQCVIAVYPDPNRSDFYYIYKSNGYKLYKSGVDLAFLEPELVSGHSKAGTLGQLSDSARSSVDTALCTTAGIGDHITVLGYPGIGGDTLTVTDGIVSGFEFREGARYIKTSAKIDQGNSGGIAIKDSGCLVGIPTYVQFQNESLGRILDLYHLLN
ncbi:trypsin-like peptidase domain-containing protein [Patescibacteria group bacterium]|nr:trypsin-like peptidase domain-containing protein [Patescibacteria group bacterium]